MPMTPHEAVFTADRWCLPFSACQSIGNFKRALNGVVEDSDSIGQSHQGLLHMDTIRMVDIGKLDQLLQENTQKIVVFLHRN